MKILKRKAVFHAFFTIILVAVLLLGCSPAFLSTVPQEQIIVPEHVTLTWTGDPRTSQTITWRTEAGVEAGVVEYGKAVKQNSFLHPSKKVAAGGEELPTNLGDIMIHSATLTDLKPGTRYFYRIGNGTGWSEPQFFVTERAGAADFKFLIFGDSQSIRYDVWGTTLKNAYQANPDAAFLINMGDLVDVGQDYAQWNSWFEAARGVIDTIPVMPVTGNHEAYTPERRFSRPEFFTAQFKLPPNGPEELTGQVYSFDYGDVHFIVLDTQAGEQARFLPDMLESQILWLKQDLEATDKRWKVVLMHRPPFNNKAGEADENIRKAFVPVFDRYHVDIVFTAHDHVYARTYPLRGGEAMDSYAEGTVYVPTGRSGSKTYKNTLAQSWNTFFYNPQDEPNYITVEVSGNVLAVKAFRQSGGLIDAWGINKE